MGCKMAETCTSHTLFLKIPESLITNLWGFWRLSAKLSHFRQLAAPINSAARGSSGLEHCTGPHPNPVSLCPRSNKMYSPVVHNLLHLSLCRVSDTFPVHCLPSSDSMPIAELSSGGLAGRNLDRNGQGFPKEPSALLLSSYFPPCSNRNCFATLLIFRFDLFLLQYFLFTLRIMSG